MATDKKQVEIPGRLHSVATEGVVAGANEILDDNKGKNQQEINASVDDSLQENKTNIANEITRATNAENAIKGGSSKSIQNLDSRLSTVEAHDTISMDGGSVVVGTAEDFTNRTTAGDAKIPTVGAILNGADEEPTANSNNLVKSGGVQNELALGAVYDVSAKNPTAGPNNDGKFESLPALLSDNNLNTLIPTSVRRGGMSIKFVQSSDNKYLQYRLTKDEWSTITSDWVEADSNKVDSKVLYVTDGSGNIIAKIDKDGVHSVDFKIGSNGDSVVEAINGISGQISSAVNAEKLLREQGDTTVTGLVEAEEARAKTAEDTKLNYTIIDDKFCITDANGYIICQIDASGVNSVDVKVKVDEELVSVKTLIDKKLDQTLDSSTLEVTDSNGYIVARIDKDGIHSAKDKHAVACMVLSESYYPTAAPTRDSDGNVTYAEVMFETGIAGSISITYTNGNSSSVAVVYGNYNYTITINRDSDGNVETVNVQ